MKKIMITLVTAAALTLTGCSANSEKPIIDETSSSTVESSVTSTTSEAAASKVESGTSTNVSKPVASTTSAVSSEKPVTSTASTEKPVVSSSMTSSTTSSTKPVTSTTSTEKPATSSSTSSTKPVEAPVHSHTFTEATCEKPATCTTCGETKGNALRHKYNNGVCVYCGRFNPNYGAANRCEKWGHTWGEYYTKTYTEDFELKESHNVYGNGFDATLARRYGCNTNPNFNAIFDMEYSSGSTPVKTTATRTVTDYYHKCSECGASEKYDTDEDVTTSDNWKVASSSSKKCPIIWWDEDDIPSGVWDWVEQDKQAKEDFFNSL